LNDYYQDRVWKWLQDGENGGGLCDWGGGFGGKVESKFEKIWLKM